MSRGISGFNTTELGSNYGAPLVVFSVQTEAATAAYTVMSAQPSMQVSYRVLDVVAYATAAGGAADTVTVKNGDTAITNALDLNVSDKVVVRAGTIDDAECVLEPGDTLTVATASGAVAYVQIFCVRV